MNEPTPKHGPHDIPPPCETCRYWQRFHGDLGECTKMSVGVFKGIVSLGVATDDSEPLRGDGWASGVRTQAGFGCRAHTDFEPWNRHQHF